MFRPIVVFILVVFLITPGTSLQHTSLHSLLRSRCCSRARVPLLSESGDAQMATQAVAWFDEVSMLQVFYMGDLRHDIGAADADAIEAAIVASGGNVSRFLTPEGRTLPRGGDAALAALKVCFSVEISDGDSDAAMPPREVRLRVCFTQVPSWRLGSRTASYIVLYYRSTPRTPLCKYTHAPLRAHQGYPLLGERPSFGLLHDMPSSELPQEGAEALISAADVAVEQALAEGEAMTIYTAVGAAREAMAEGLWRGPERRASTRGSSADTPASPAAVPELIAPAAEMIPPALESLRGPNAGGAWAVLGPHGKPLHDVLVSWDEQRCGTCSSEDFQRAAQALAALGVCARQPTALELDSMFELLAERAGRLRLSRLLEPLDAINALVKRRLTGVECRNWLELDKWADQSYNWCPSPVSP